MSWLCCVTCCLVLAVAVGCAAWWLLGNVLCRGNHPCRFEKYGGLSASLRQILDAPPEVDMDEYQQRSRVQVSCCEGDMAVPPEQGTHHQGRDT